MKKQIILTILCLIAVLVSVSAVSAANIYVNGSVSSSGDGGSWGEAVKTIYEGYNLAANTGDTVNIADGTYSGTGNNQINIHKTITIQGQSQEGTIINGTGHWAFEVHDDGNATIQKLTFVNCDYNNDEDMGTAIYVEDSGTATVNDCTFKDNSAGEDNNGGAIGNDGYLTVNRCTFINNHAQDGGAIYHCDGTVTVKNSIFTGNTAINGGAIFTHGETSTTIIGCNFNKNSVTNNGGAILTNDDLTVKYSRFVGNNADIGKDIYLAYGQLNATLNWWGSNSGPAAGRLMATPNEGNTPVNVPSNVYTPWLVMNILPADPSTIYTGQTSKITVNVYKDSAGGDHSADAAQFFSGPEVKFTTNLGNVGSKEVTVPWTLGMAFAILRGDEGAGTATVTAADGEIRSTTVTILQAPTANAASNTVGMQETGLPIAGLILAILAVFGGLLVPKR